MGARARKRPPASHAGDFPELTSDLPQVPELISRINDDDLLRTPYNNTLLLFIRLRTRSFVTPRCDYLDPMSSFSSCIFRNIPNFTGRIWSPRKPEGQGTRDRGKGAPHIPTRGSGCEFGVVVNPDSTSLKTTNRCTDLIDLPPSSFPVEMRALRVGLAVDELYSPLL